MYKTKNGKMMRKIYVSLPIVGKDENEVRLRCEKAKAKYTIDGDVVVTPIDVIESFTMPYATAVGKCIAALLDCDHAVFLNGWADANECNLELQTCLLYCIDYHVDARL